MFAKNPVGRIGIIIHSFTKQAMPMMDNLRTKVLHVQAWHGLLVSKIQELQEFCSGNIGDTGKGDFYENTGEFHQFQKYRRNWPF